MSLGNSGFVVHCSHQSCQAAGQQLPGFAEGGGVRGSCPVHGAMFISISDLCPLRAGAHPAHGLYHACEIIWSGPAKAGLKVQYSYSRLTFKWIILYGP